MPTITLHVNGRNVELHVDSRETLLEVLRDKLGIISVKQGCGVGECGACNILLDGIAVDSCLTLAVWADGKCIRTVEGELKQDGELSLVQKAYIDAGAVQCGFCTPGLVMTTTDFVEKNANRAHEVSREEIRKAHAGHLCRCTGYEMVIQAVELALGKKVKGSGERVLSKE